MAILVLFEQFSGRQILFIFLAPNFECFTKYDAFCSHSFDNACLRRLRHIVMKRFKIAEKFYSSIALLKIAGRRDASPTSPPDPPLVSVARQCQRRMREISKFFPKIVLAKYSLLILTIEVVLYVWQQGMRGMHPLYQLFSTMLWINKTFP